MTNFSDSGDDFQAPIPCKKRLLTIKTPAKKSSKETIKRSLVNQANELLKVFDYDINDLIQLVDEWETGKGS